MLHLACFEALLVRARECGKPSACPLCRAAVTCVVRLVGLDVESSGSASGTANASGEKLPTHLFGIGASSKTATTTATRTIRGRDPIEAYNELRRRYESLREDRSSLAELVDRSQEEVQELASEVEDLQAHVDELKESEKAARKQLRAMRALMEKYVAEQLAQYGDLQSVAELAKAQASMDAQEFMFSVRAAMEDAKRRDTGALAALREKAMTEMQMRKELRVDVDRLELTAKRLRVENAALKEENARLVASSSAKKAKAESVAPSLNVSSVSSAATTSGGARLPPPPPPPPPREVLVAQVQPQRRFSSMDNWVRKSR